MHLYEFVYYEFHAIDIFKQYLNWKIGETCNKKKTNKDNFYFQFYTYHLYSADDNVSTISVYRRMIIWLYLGLEHGQNNKRG